MDIRHAGSELGISSVDNKVYIGDEDGDVCILLSKEMELLAEINMGNSVYSTPIVANETLYRKP